MITPANIFSAVSLTTTKAVEPSDNNDQERERRQRENARIANVNAVRHRAVLQAKAAHQAQEECDNLQEALAAEMMPALQRQFTKDLIDAYAEELADFAQTHEDSGIAKPLVRHEASPETLENRAGDAGKNPATEHDFASSLRAHMEALTQYGDALAKSGDASIVDDIVDRLRMLHESIANDAQTAHESVQRESMEGNFDFLAAMYEDLPISDADKARIWAALEGTGEHATHEEQREGVLPTWSEFSATLRENMDKLARYSDTLVVEDIVDQLRRLGESVAGGWHDEATGESMTPSAEMRRTSVEGSFDFLLALYDDLPVNDADKARIWAALEGARAEALGMEQSEQPSPINHRADVSENICTEAGRDFLEAFHDESPLDSDKKPRMADAKEIAPDRRPMIRSSKNSHSSIETAKRAMNHRKLKSAVSDYQQWMSNLTQMLTNVPTTAAGAVPVPILVNQWQQERSAKPEKLLAAIRATDSATYKIERRRIMESYEEAEQVVEALANEDDKERLRKLLNQEKQRVLGEETATATAAPNSQAQQIHATDNIQAHRADTLPPDTLRVI
jgi:hypothetical protein